MLIAASLLLAACGGADGNDVLDATAQRASYEVPRMETLR